MKNGETNTELLLQELTKLRRRVAELEGPDMEAGEAEQRQKFVEVAAAYVSEGVAVCDEDGYLLYFDHTFAAMYGHSSETLIGMHVSSLHMSDQSPSWNEIISHGKEHGVFTGEVVYRKADGTWIPARLSLSSLQGEGAMLAGFILRLRDIADLRRAEVVARETEIQFRDLVDNAPVGVYKSTVDGGLLYANKAFADMMEFETPEALIAEGVLKLYKNAADRQRLLALLQERGHAVNVEVDLLTKMGMCKHVAVSAVIDEQVISGMVMDVTERKRATAVLQMAQNELEGKVKERTAELMMINQRLKEEIEERQRFERALQESELKYRTLFESTPDSIMMLDRKGFFDCNSATLSLFGCHSREEFVTKHPGELSPPRQLEGADSLLSAAEHIDKAFQKGSEFFEWTHRRIDGTVFSSEVLLSKLELGGRQVLQAVVRDITERKRAEGALRNREAELRHIVEGSPVPTFVIDSNHRVTYWNKACENLTGILAVNITGTSRHRQVLFPAESSLLNDLIVDNVPEEEIIRLAGNKAKKSPIIDQAFEIEQFLPHLGETGRWVSFSAAPLKDGTGNVTGAIGVLEDVTEHRRAEKALQESEERYRNIFNNALVALREEDFSELKRAIEELRAQGVSNFREYVDDHPEFVERAKKMIKVVDVNEATLKLYGAKDKTQFAKREKIFAPAGVPTFRESIIAVAEGKQSFEAESKNQTFQGRPIDILLKIAYPSGTTSNALVSIMDISERKRAEAALQESQDRFATFMNHLPGIVFMQDEGFSVTYTNKYVREAFGTRSNVLETRVRAKDKQSLFDGMKESIEKLTDRHGGVNYYRIFHFPILRKGKRPMFGGIGIDITKQVEAEKALQAAYDELEEKVIERTAELVQINKQLTLEIAAHRDSQRALREQTLLNELILETTMNGFFIADLKGKILQANPAAAVITGYSQEDLRDKDILTVYGSLDSVLINQYRKEMIGEKHIRFETKSRKKSGEVIDLEVSQNFLESGSHKILFSFFSDITKRKQAEQALKEREKELELKSGNLEEANAALRFLLKKREEDKKELETDVLSNMKELVLPYMEKLKKSGLDAKQMSYADVLISNLHDITSSFSHHISSKFMNLTHMEIQIANLINQGKTSKEIADIFNLSVRTIESHRRNMRRKTGIQNKPTNLRTHLLSFK
ncbi:MAG: PAS domain S-box protein [Deltaproteobacteria bacterium]|nr:PAS domain S-box protein [Deltaproteobacteria bacterium]